MPAPVAGIHDDCLDLPVSTFVFWRQALTLQKLDDKAAALIDDVGLWVNVVLLEGVAA